uniref:Uncharacterized protein n=1 Tax=Romanomermis culicivorax TaxID=13658 RepID=A0A915JPE4_ROMCU
MSKFLQFFGSRSSFLRKNGQNSIKFLSTDLTDEKTLKMMRKLKIGATIVGVICGGASIFGYYLEKTICKASDLVVHPLEVPFFHKQSIWHGYDVKAVRRGYQVYKQVCQACHSVMIYEYRHFVNQIMTEDEARAEAAEMTVEDGPNDNGEYFTRPVDLLEF